MMKLNLQFFAHKRELVLQRTDVIPSLRDLEPRERTDSLLKPATSFTDSAERRSTRASMLGAAVTIHYLRLLTAL